MKGGKIRYQWPADLKLGPGETLRWPFLLRLTEEGQTTLHCVWQYEADPQQPAMPFRLLNWSHALEVPHLSCNSSTYVWIVQIAMTATQAGQ